MKISRTDQGYIALLSIIIVGAAAMATALILLTTGTNAQKNSLTTQQSIQARQLVQACAEEALQVIHDTTSYIGTNSLTLGAGSCAYTVASTGTSTRLLTISGSVGGVVRKAAVYVTINSSSISVTSWQEVS